MADLSSTRDALLEQGALLFARHGVGSVSTRQLHEAVGARNESAVHYHFGGRAGLVEAIVKVHLEAVEQRRAALVAAIERDGRTDDVRALIAALAVPMAADLQTTLGRAHLRIVAQLSHPALAYASPFENASTVVSTDAPAGAQVVAWLRDALPDMPPEIRRERLAALRTQLIGQFGVRAQLLDDTTSRRRDAANGLFLENLIDMVVAGLCTPPSPPTIEAADALAPRRKGRRR